jgi:hypothetical protein
MVAVVVRDDDGIDRLGVDAGGGEVGQELAVCPLARIEPRLAQAGVDDHELLSGIDDDGIVGGDKNIRLDEAANPYKFVATVVAVARSEEDFGALAQARDWALKAPDPSQWVWTDDYCNIVGAVLRKLNE